jgi:hypothetical protein
MGCYEKSNIKKDIDFVEIKNLYHKTSSNDEKIFYNIMCDLFKSIFIYDYDNRLTSDMYIHKFLF